MGFQEIYNEFVLEAQHITRVGFQTFNTNVPFGKTFTH